MDTLAVLLLHSALLQIAITLNFDRIFMSGLDLVGACSRFHNEIKTHPTNLPLDFEYILKLFRFMSEQHCGEKYNLSTKTAVPYEIFPFADPNKLMP